MKYFYLSIAFIIMLLMRLTPCTTYANNKGVSIIRDSEIENFLYDLTRPILKVAHLDYRNIKIYIVEDSSINAFVAGGQNIFVNTGLITKYDKPDVLLGVLAHETGHIASGHLARSSEEMDQINTAMILTYLAGFAAALSSSPDAGYAIIMGGNQIGERLALKYTRTQEEAADRLALKYLSALNYSPAGLLELLEYFDQQEVGFKNVIDEFAQTHPVSKKRIEFIKANMIGKNYHNAVLNAILEPRLKRINVKIEAFFEDPDKILQKYDGREDELAKYGQSIAYFKKGKIDQSLKILNGLIESKPSDPYLWDLKGQILFESGSVAQSVIAYKQALSLISSHENWHKALIRIALATSIIALNSNDVQFINLAIDNLNLAHNEEDDNLEVFKELALAYDQIGKKGRSYLALAEFNLLRDDEKKAREYAKLAQDNLDQNDRSGLIEAGDILAVIKDKSDNKKDKKGKKKNNINNVMIRNGA